MHSFFSIEEMNEPPIIFYILGWFGLSSKKILIFCLGMYYPLSPFYYSIPILFVKHDYYMAYLIGKEK